MPNDYTDDDRSNDYLKLRRELWRRTHEPVRELPFVVYVFTGILLFGGLGVWVEILKIILAGSPVEFAGLITAVVTFFPALIGSTTLQLVLGSVNGGDKVMVSFALLMMCVFLTFAILLPFFSGTHPIGVLGCGIACSAFAIWTWWITNGDDPDFKKVVKPDAATGGNPQRQLPGDLNGFQV